MTELLEKLLSVVVEGLIVAIPLLIALLRMYVLEKRAHVETKKERDNARKENELLGEEHKSALQRSSLDEETASVQSNYIRSSIKKKVTGSE